MPLIDSGRRLLIRLRGDLHLLLGEQSLSAFEISSLCRLPYRDSMVRQEPGAERIWPLRFRSRAVRLPVRPKVQLYLVVMKGPWQHPLVLLTIEKPGHSRRSPWRLVESYLTRSQFEETIRFIKQSY